MMQRSSFVLAAFVALAGCGVTGQAVLSTQARVVMDTQKVRFDLYGKEHKRCINECSDFVGYKSCMSLARHVARASDSYAEALEAAQAAYNVRGKKAFEEMLPCLIAAAENLIASIKAANLPIPEEVADIAGFVGQFGSVCDG